MQEKMRGDGACGKRLEIVQNQDQQAGYRTAKKAE
jgi:hypothetical protein